MTELEPPPMKCARGGVEETTRACAQRRPGGRATSAVSPNRMGRSTEGQITSLGDLALHPEQGSLGKLLSREHIPHMDTLTLCPDQNLEFEMGPEQKHRLVIRPGPCRGRWCGRGVQMSFLAHEHFVKNTLGGKYAFPIASYLLLQPLLTPEAT